MRKKWSRRAILQRCGAGLLSAGLVTAGCGSRRGILRAASPIRYSVRYLFSGADAKATRTTPHRDVVQGKVGVGFAALNNRGDVVGIEGVLTAQQRPILLKSNGQRLPLTFSDAIGYAVLNDAGLIAASVSPNGVTGYTDVAGTVEVWDKGAITRLPAELRSSPRSLSGITRDGSLVGVVFDREVPVRGFVFQGADPTPPDSWQSPTEIVLDGFLPWGGTNDDLMLVGNLASSPCLPARWYKGVVRVLENLGGSPVTAPNAVNAQGRIVGYGYGPNRQDAVRWDDLRATVLDGIGTGRATYALDVATNGDIVGLSAPLDVTDPFRLYIDSFPLLWQRDSTTPVDLNTRIPPGSGWVLGSALRINDVGQILGAGRYQGEPAAYLLTPILAHPI